MSILRQVTSRIIIVIKFEKCLTSKVVLPHNSNSVYVCISTCVCMLCGETTRWGYWFIWHTSHIKCYFCETNIRLREWQRGNIKLSNEFINYCNLYPHEQNLILEELIIWIIYCYNCYYLIVLRQYINKNAKTQKCRKNIRNKWMFN